MPFRFKYKSHRRHPGRVYWHKNPDEVVSGSRKNTSEWLDLGDHGVVSALEQKEDKVAFGDGKQGGGCGLCQRRRA